MKRWIRLEYCPHCGEDVDADYCSECGTFTHELEEDTKCQSIRTNAKWDIDLKSFDRLRKRQKIQRVQKRVVDDRPEEQFPR